MTNILKRVRYLIGSASILMAAAASAEMTSTTYVCHIETTSGQDGLVYVQTSLKKVAEEMARVSNAINLQSQTEPVKKVVQCVLSTERLKDSTVANFEKNLPK